MPAGLLGLLGFFFFSCQDGLPSPGQDSSQPRSIDMAKAWYLEINLHTPPVQNAPFYGSAHSSTLLEVLRLIKRAGDDKRISGIVLNAAGFSAERESLWELRSALEDFKSRGKKVIAFFDNADFDLYLLLSAADKIVMDQGGSLFLLGYAAGRGYFHQTLERLGIGVREHRYFTYKSALESFTRSSFSEADREQYGAWLDDIYGLSKETLIKARSLSEADFNAILNEEFIYSAQGAKARLLVDETGRRETLSQVTRELEGEKDINYVVWGDPASSLMSQKRRPVRYNAERPRGPFQRAPEIAVVYASGSTDMDQGMGARRLSRSIRELSEKPSVKALVLRINSPGGSAIAADYIAEAVRDARQHVPVVVSMGQVAASGGYWAAMYANHIVVSPYTLTGSIGVIGGWFYDKGLHENLGLAADTLTRGNHADLLSGIILPRRDLRAEEEERFKALMLDLYGEFVGKAAAGRNMTVEAVEAAAQGRIYSGGAALELGLADSLGGLTEALEEAQKLAGIPGTKKLFIREYPRPRLLQNLIARTLNASLPRASSPLGGAALLVPGGGTARALEVLEEIRYRISHNGEVMPILPLAGLELF